MSFIAAQRRCGGFDPASRAVEWWTPPEFFHLVDREFRFDIDLCAGSRRAAKCRRFYSPREDALRQEWRGVCWLNPPYTPSVRPWLDKAAEAAEQHGATIVALLAARWDVSWWRENVMRRAAEIRFLTRSLRFHLPSHRVSSAAMPGVLAIYRKHSAPSRVVFWDWQEGVWQEFCGGGASKVTSRLRR